METTKFTWVPFYTELAHKLLEYKNKRHELIDFIFAEDGLLEFSNYLHLKDKNQRIDDIDPFSFFGMFNRGLNESNRLKVLEKIKNRFNIKADMPSDFLGIPILNYTRNFFYDWNNLKESCNHLWIAFEAILNGNLEPWFEYRNFTDKMAETTMVLYWIDANKYINLDSKNTAYLKHYQINTKINNAQSYLDLVEQIKSKIQSGEIKENSFMEFSYNAWLNVKDSEKKSNRYWLYAPGDNAKYWGEFYDNGIMGIGWEDLGDLSEYTDKNSIKTALDNEYGTTDSSRMNDVLCNWQFAHEMNVGDVVFVKRGTSKILGYGVVASDYYYDDNREYFNSVREVNWKAKGEWEHPTEKNAVLKTLTDITKYKDYVDKLNQLFAMDTTTAPNHINKYAQILSQKKNLILQGAPGTGKTYNTAALALSTCEVADVDLTDHDAVMQRYKQLQDEGRIGFCTFHQSMDYEDFVEGIKPNTEDGVVSYEVEDGIFKQMADKARENWENYENNAQLLIEKKHKTIDVLNGYCEKIQREIDENSYANLFLDNKSKMKIFEVFTKRDKIKSIRLKNSTLDNAQSVQGLNAEIILRDYELYTRGEIKSYKDIKPKYESKSEYHGNAIYYFELFKRMAEYEKTMELPQNNYQKPELQSYVLIIDEINRGNVSRIFGELITLLEADKRLGGEHPGDHPIEVTLPYSKERFGVPQNLYIIGTMNTTDRSVGNIDYAVRRRFAFATLESQRELVEQHSTEQAVRLYDAVREFIDKRKAEMDFEDLMVGHSYFFVKSDEHVDSDEQLEMRWQYEIKPLLNEYIKDGLLNATTIKTDVTVVGFVGEGDAE